MSHPRPSLSGTAGFVLWFVEWTCGGPREQRLRGGGWVLEVVVFLFLGWWPFSSRFLGAVRAPSSQILGWRGLCPLGVVPPKSWGSSPFGSLGGVVAPVLFEGVSSMLSSLFLDVLLVSLVVASLLSLFLFKNNSSGVSSGGSPSGGSGLSPLGLESGGGGPPHFWRGGGVCLLLVWWWPLFTWWSGGGFPPPASPPCLHFQERKQMESIGVVVAFLLRKWWCFVFSKIRKNVP